MFGVLDCLICENRSFLGWRWVRTDPNGVHRRWVVDWTVLWRWRSILVSSLPSAELAADPMLNDVSILKWCERLEWEQQSQSPISSSVSNIFVIFCISLRCSLTCYWMMRMLYVILLHILLKNYNGVLVMSNDPGIHKSRCFGQNTFFRQWRPMHRIKSQSGMKTHSLVQLSGVNSVFHLSCLMMFVECGHLPENAEKKKTWLDASSRQSLTHFW